jgi:photosystem II stability/assembly factor-like uncharacterized protein
MNAKLLTPLLLSSALFAQLDLNSLKELKYRSIGPYRGGRAVAAAGVTSQPGTYYFGATGGGIWKTVDGGASWQPISDGQLKSGSVGAIAVSESDPSVVYVGMGEPDIRGNASPGDGMYKSNDAGRTWTHIGLEATQQIGAVRIHPKNPDIVYVAALGHQFGPNPERGIYKTVDGGKTWKQVFTRGPKAGAVELAMDPNSPNTLYAGFWEVYRTPWDLESGGPGSGLFKSTDGGDTWTDLTRNTGMPKGLIGRVGVAVSPVNSDRVWALVEAEDGGVFRSEDAGKTWAKVNDQRMLRQRAWYYTRIFADPHKLDTCYVVNVGFFRSDDGGKTYTQVHAPHGDNHYLWISPNDSNRMIEVNDGGATISTDNGKTWSTQNNQPTAQFYRVAVDNEFPYWAYGAQQDNTTVKIQTRSDGPGITERNWYDVGGGESGWIQPDPKNSDVVYAGSYDGLLTRYEHRTGQMRNITVYPDNPMGAGAEAMKYRFQWDFPIFLSPHDPNVLYAAGNVLFKSTNEGQSWQAISKDLTRDDKSKQGPSGGPITKDNTAVEYYCTIFTGAESPVKAGVIWTGSDDGLVYYTPDGGQTWNNVTPKDLPEWSRINSIEASPFDAGTAYFAATKYQLDDFTPLLYKTTDYGKTWKRINTGIPANHFTRVIREDPNHRHLLFAGTEFGIYVSFNGGDTWQPAQLNLPVVPITDLAFHKRDKELVVATQGRSFWILDELPLLYQLADAQALKEDAHLFQPKDSIREAMGGFHLPSTAPVGQNPTSGAVVYYWLKDKPKGDITLEFLDGSGKLVKTFSSKEPPKPKKAEGAEDEEEGPFGRPPNERLPTEKGLNRFVWDLRYPDATKFPGMILWAASVRGPLVVPGQYTAKLTLDGKTQSQTFEVKKDPRIGTTPQEFARQLEVAMQVLNKLSATNQAVIDIRDMRKQLDDYADRAKNPKVVDSAKALAKKLTDVEEALYQTKNRASEDPLNFPIKLNNKLASLLEDITMSDSAPTAQQDMVYEDLASKVNAELRKLGALTNTEVPQFNKLVRDENVPAVTVKNPGDSVK